MTTPITEAQSTPIQERPSSVQQQVVEPDPNPIVADAIEGEDEAVPGSREDVDEDVNEHQEDVKTMEDVELRVKRNKRLLKQVKDLQDRLHDAVRGRERARSQTNNLQRRVRALSDTIIRAYPLSTKAVTHNDISHRHHLQALLFEETEDINIYHRHDKDFEAIEGGD
ncbi:hypothetical protein BKA70DRAFT_1403011 [Coprinopsis sp. MPI-PUGE-AT-0042]|nr:hypothetical protein BKA70DRAFT_1403011 [Coprinopsis sp. MPI-PUGE-AT-0042]